jgi:PAS domain S-box-containing protein
MDSRGNVSQSLIKLDSGFSIFITAALTVILCYLAARLGGMLVLRPQMMWPLWPGCALLVAVLLLTPRKIWPYLIPAGFAGFMLNDLLVFGLSIRASGILILADTLEILIAALGINYFFGSSGLRLNSLQSLAKYLLVAVILAPMSAAFVSSTAFNDSYWVYWGIAVLTEGLALLTLTPAIFGIARAALTPQHISLDYYLEAMVMMSGLVMLGYITFISSSVNRPELLYSLLPFLLWSALRFGITGTSISINVVAFLSIWGVVHGHGPFVGRGPLNDILSLQLFLLFAATSFMCLAALVEGDRETEAALRESEERFHLAAQAGRMFAYEWHVRTDEVAKSPEYRNVLGLTDAPLGATRQQFLDRVLPDDRARFISEIDALTPANPSTQFSFRLMRPDGSVIWLEKNGRAFFGADGKMVRMIGMVADITERKLAEEALSGVSRKLIEAQEQERARIARELHDDIGQRLALLAVELDRIQQNSSKLPAEILTQIVELQQQTMELSTDIHNMSHALHAPKLEYLGLAAAMRSICNEFGQHQRMEIDFRSQDLPTPAPEVSLCLIRVLQESLQNAAKHSGVRHVDVQLQGAGDEIHLTVSDLGMGFDLNTAMRGQGLGLTSMKERVRVVNGTIMIQSKPMCGTSVHVCIPVISGHTSQRAAG